MSNDHEATQNALTLFDAAWGASRDTRIGRSQITVSYPKVRIASLREACEAVQGAGVFQDLAMPVERGLKDVLHIVDGGFDSGVSYHAEATQSAGELSITLFLYHSDTNEMRGPMSAAPLFNSCQRILGRIGSGDVPDATVAFVGWLLRPGGTTLEAGAQKRLAAGIARLLAERLARE